VLRTVGSLKATLLYYKQRHLLVLRCAALYIYTASLCIYLARGKILLIGQSLVRQIFGLRGKPFFILKFNFLRYIRNMGTSKKPNRSLVKKSVFIAAALLAFAAVPLAAQGNNRAQAGSGQQPQKPYDYSKILKGDFSEFAGIWASGGAGGSRFRLNSNGTIADGERAAGFSAKPDGSYVWSRTATGVNSATGMALFPEGVDVIADGKIIQTDKTKVRILVGKYFSNDDIYYQVPLEQASPVAASAGKYDSKILRGNLSDFTGFWANGEGQRARLNSDGVFALQKPDGTFRSDLKAGGFKRGSGMSSGDYIWMNWADIDGGGYAVALFPIGVEITVDGKIIQSDKTKVRIVSGQAPPSSSSAVFYMETRRSRYRR